MREERMNSGPDPLAEVSAAIRPVVIMGAMDVETDLLIERTGPCRLTETGPWRFYEGSLDGYPTVIADTLMGSVNAAAAAAIAIQKYDPVCLITQGTSGAHRADIHTGDIVIGASVVQLGLRVSSPRAEGAGSSVPEWEYPGSEFREESRHVMRQILHSDGSLVRLAQSVPYEGGQCIVGTIASGDMWNREADVIHAFRQRFGTDCEEMESFAVFQTAKAFGVPALAIRIISNNELIPGEEYDRDIGVLGQQYVLDVARAIIEEHKK